MDDQTAPVTPDEYILRRILNREDYYKPDLPIPVQRVAVGPSSKDENGISVYREKFVTAQQVAEAGEYESGYYVARFRAQDAMDLGFTITPDPVEDELPGHSLIPQLGGCAKRDDVNKYREMALDLAKLLRDIVYTPNP